jgi:hypothetical protein
MLAMIRLLETECKDERFALHFAAAARQYLHKGGSWLIKKKGSKKSVGRSGVRVEAVRREEADIRTLADAMLLLIQELPAKELEELQKEVEKQTKAKS